MSIQATEVFELHCDQCGAAFTWEEFEQVAIWNSVAEVETFVREWWTQEYSDSADWSTDGEGRVRCGSHEPLTITDAARDELARIPGPNDVPLISVDEVTA